ncbi:hydroxyacid dehydrogenase [Leptospira interrogans]
MANIVVTEFIDAGVLDVLHADYSVHHDPSLWTKPEELRALSADAVGMIVRNRTQVDEALLAVAPKLKVVGRLGVGLDNIDMPACKARGVVVCPAVGANAVSVAEYVIASALILPRGPMFFGSHRLAAGEWPREEMTKGRENFGRRFGIIGFGSIGQIVGEKAKALGMEIVAYDGFIPADSVVWQKAQRLTLDELLETSDIITLHCPLTPETRGLIGARELARMKKGAVLINTSRGGVVDEPALADALRSGHLAGAAVDVFTAEPIDRATGAIFRDVPNVILTPHVAGVTLEANMRVSTMTVENVRRELKALQS